MLPQATPLFLTWTRQMTPDHQQIHQSILVLASQLLKLQVAKTAHQTGVPPLPSKHSAKPTVALTQTICHQIQWSQKSVPHETTHVGPSLQNPHPDPRTRQPSYAIWPSCYWITANLLLWICYSTKSKASKIQKTRFPGPWRRNVKNYRTI